LSTASANEARTESAGADSVRALFSYVVRRDGRVIATLQGHRSGSGVDVESEVFPVTATDDEPGLKRTFSFPSPEHAGRFVEDAIVAFEYLNCVIT
jgi:hypothetical protein